MFDTATLLVFSGASLALAVTPGPDMAFCLAAGARAGVTGAVVAALGLVVGLAIHSAAAAAGLAALLAATPLGLDAVRWVGAAYLVWIAIHAWNTPVRLEPAPGARRELGLLFVRALLTNLMNPKIIMFFLAFLPQFANPAKGPVWLQMLLLGLLFAAIGIWINVAVGASAGAVRRLFARNPKAGLLLARGTSVIFLGLAARLALSRL
ncbi:LysE family translocator [Futiania mangrovi]|uniref:LysE family translocator n=1 Tax=Futiania mangrovi TaxID=2959716 RepID=A0A9J6PIE6_9PROT|nr:LysE family translocator [Futiania mangrovii]MCP1337576.1 LysE family translocator [Futiania mangrovii]